MADGHGQRWRRPKRQVWLDGVTKRRLGLLLKHNPVYSLTRILKELKKTLSKQALPRFKQLLVVDGETLLQRQVRLLKRHGVSEIYIASSNPEIEAEGAIRYTPINNLYEIDRFSSSSGLWNTEGETLYIYGDVYYTDLAMNVICALSARDWLWFGRPHPSFIPEHGDPEVFAFRFQPQCHQFIMDNIDRVRTEYIEGRHHRCIGWDLMRSLAGLPLSSPELPANQFVEISDITTDFDTLIEYQSWVAFYEKARPTQVFVELNDILKKFNINKCGVIHVGSHICRELEFYKDFKSVCLIDANPLLGPFLEFASQWNSRIETFNCAVDEHEKKMDFFLTEYEQASSLLYPFEHSMKSKVSVRTTPLRVLQDNQNVLVIDVQGAELRVLRSANLDPVELIVCEVNDRQRYEGAATSEELVEFISRAGFEFFKKYPHGNYGISDHVFVRRVNSSGTSR